MNLKEQAMRIVRILSLPEHVKRREALHFAMLHGQDLLCYPLYEETRDAYGALIRLYNYLGKCAQEEKKYEEATRWYSRSFLIIRQSDELQREFADTFIYLSYCCTKLSKFTPAFRYISRHHWYDNDFAALHHDVQQLVRETKSLHRKVYSEAFREAIGITRLAIAIAPEAPPWLHFNLATFYATCHREDKAIFHLEKALKKGYQNWERIFNDDHLRVLTHTPEFKTMLMKVQGSGF